MPHNLLVADEGMTIYILPRKFDLIIENVNFFTSFETLCGFVKCKIESAYKTLTFAEYSKRMSSFVGLEQKQFDQLKYDITQKFLSEYDGQVMASN